LPLGATVVLLPQEAIFVHNPQQKRTTTHHLSKSSAGSDSAPIEGLSRGAQPSPFSHVTERVRNPPQMIHNTWSLLHMIPGRGARILECVNKCPHAVKRKYGQLRKNSELNKAVRRLARMNSELKYVLVEMKALEVVRNWRINGRRFREPDNQFLMYCCGRMG
jgi:hypothetical protein